MQISNCDIDVWNWSNLQIISMCYSKSRISIWDIVKMTCCDVWKNIRRKERDVRVENNYQLKNYQDCIIDCVWNLRVIAKIENFQIKNRMACVEKCLKRGIDYGEKIKFQNQKQNIAQRSFLQECIYSAGYHGEAIPELNMIWI